MDKLEKYRSVLQDIVLRYAQYQLRDSEIETLPVCDAVRGQYLLLDIGWRKDGRRVENIIFYFRLSNGKIYVECDNTDAEPVQQMLDAGIPQQDIVLAFYSAKHRKLTDFAAA